MNLPELFALLARRDGLVSELRDGPRSKGELVAVLAVSRSTVDRTVRRLEQAGLVERQDGAVALTLAGRLVFDEYRAFRERAGATLDVRSALACLPVDADIDPAALVGADVTVPERTVPYRPAERQSELIAVAEGVDLLGTAVVPRLVEAYHTAIVDDGTVVRAAVTSDVAQRLVADHAEALSAMLATGRLSLRVLDGVPPFSLARFERPDGECLTLMVHTADGPQAHIENDTKAAVAYAVDHFERHWTRADPVPADGTDA